MKRIRRKIFAFFKKETVLCVALILALFSMFLVPPDRDYLDYIDFRTLAVLFCLMCVMAGLQKIGVFDRIARKPGFFYRWWSCRPLGQILAVC